MLDHVGIPVSDFTKSKGFYLRVLKPLGYGLVVEVASPETGGESQLLLAGGLIDSLPAMPRRGHEAARLRRIRVQPIGTTGAAAEVAATYTRGRRLHAIACRVQRVDTATGPRWQVVALHIG